MKSLPSFGDLEEVVCHCRLCPRLVQYRENVPARASFKNQTYWRKPLPGFGDHQGWLLITGLAPSAHGGNRTGRILTGDETARFLFQALYAEGFANQPLSESCDDGLKLHSCYLTAAVKCAPPANKPTREESLNCSYYYHNEIHLLKNLTSVLALGKQAFDAYLNYAKKEGKLKKAFKFIHGATYTIEGLPKIYCTYHPSPQNTYTGLLTQDMLRKVLQKIKEDYFSNSSSKL